jgi:nucleotide-binding universal stress UspA family protein
MIQTLLFATDMGIHTHYLLHYVNSLAAQYNAKVIVVHAIAPLSPLADAVTKSAFSKNDQADNPQNQLEVVIAGVKGRMVDLLEDEYIDGQQGLSRIIDVRVLVGKPVETILEQANQCSADLIVLGSHGQDTTGENMLGSVSSKVLHLSRVPVFMVPLIRNDISVAKTG